MTATIIGADKLMKTIGGIKTATRRNGGFELYFGQGDERKKAYKLHYGIGIEASPFFALDKKQEDMAMKKVRQALRDGKGIADRLYRIASSFKLEILKRTKAGKNPDGGTQRAYKEGKYKELRASTGKPTGAVTNAFTGSMLRSINIRKI